MKLNWIFILSDYIYLNKLKQIASSFIIIIESTSMTGNYFIQVHVSFHEVLCYLVNKSSIFI